MTVNAFIDAFLATTEPNPFCNHERVWNRVAAFELRPFDGSVHLSCIRSLIRRNGHGSAALQWLCDLADEHDVTITGAIAATGHQLRPRLTVPQLKAWYRRHGFTVDSYHHIKRLPKSIAVASNRKGEINEHHE